MKTQINKQSDINSPCVRNCCLDNNDICLGCFRQLDEIIAWSQLGVEEKQQVLTKALHRKKAAHPITKFY